MRKTVVISPSRIDFSQARKEIVSAVIEHGDRRWTLPIWISCAEPGRPSLLIVAGQHGNEYQGCAILYEFLRTNWQGIHGNLIIVPATNPPALEAGLGKSPIDGGDLNRSYRQRDRPAETVTDAIADYISQILLPHADVVIDIHSGGSDWQIIPSVRTHYLSDHGILGETLAAMRATELPASVVIDESRKPGMLDTLVEGLGKLFLAAEIGGGGLAANDLALGERMVLELVERFIPSMRGSLRSGRPSGPKTEPRLVEVPDENRVMAPAAGLFTPAVSLGNEVRRGQPIGTVYPPDDPLLPLTVASPADGIVYTLWVSGQVAKGAQVGLIGTPARDQFAALWVSSAPTRH